MTSLPVLALDACEYSKISYCSKILSRAELDYYMWVRLPSNVDSWLVCQVDSITNTTDSPIPETTWSREGKQWIKFKFELLATSNGLHVYRIGLVDPVTDAHLYLYFSYYIHDSNVEKPYIYMKKEDTK